jgi:DNA-binding beta-propeller fold protein YncE
MKRYMLKAAFSFVLTAIGGLCLAMQGHAVERVPVNVVAVIAGDEMIGRLKNPSGLFFDETKKRLYVADSGNKRLISFDKDFKYITELQHEGMALPVSLVRNKDDNFIFVDASKLEVMLIEVKKENVLPFAIKGLPSAKEPVYPGRIAIDREKGLLYVIDRLNKRIIVSDSSGAFVKAVTVEGGAFAGFSDLKVDERGFVYAVDAIGRTAYVFDPDGRLALKIGGRDSEVGFRFPVSIAVDQGGFIYVADLQKDQIFVFDRAGALQHTIGRPGVREGELNHPSYIYLDREGRIYIIDGDRVQVFVESKK